MKKAILFLLLLPFSLLISAQEKRFSAGIKAGLSTSQVSGDELAGFNKAGLSAGIYTTLYFSKQWTSQLEMLFIQKGSRNVPRPEFNGSNYYRLQLNYMEVPLLLQYHYKKFLFEAGPGFSYLINYHEENETGDLTGLRPFNKTEISCQFGAGFNITTFLALNVRYSNTLNSIRNHTSGAHTFLNPGQQNTVLQLAINYTLGNRKND